MASAQGLGSILSLLGVIPRIVAQGRSILAVCVFFPPVVYAPPSSSW